MDIKKVFGSLPVKYLNPRECFVSETPTLVSTILGSCVAVTIFDPVASRGGIFHAFLPEMDKDRDLSNDICHYVDTSLDHLLASFARARLGKQALEVKLFGGSKGMQGEPTAAVRNTFWQTSVGERNIQVARRILKEYDIPIMAEDTGGTRGRKIMFLTHTGGVWVKKLGEPVVQGAGAGAIRG